MIEAVRVAHAGDAAALAALEADARANVVDHRGGRELLAEVPEVGLAGWAARLLDPRWIVVLAEIDEVPVGLLAGRVDGSRFEIEGVYVDEGARELGFGDTLLQTALEQAVSHGATVAEAVALPGDRQTKNLYERFSMKARKLVVSRRLDDL